MSGGTLSRSVYDADKCPYSGSLSTTLSAGGQAYIQQCVSNTPLVGDFNFGADVSIVAANGLQANANALCLVRFFVGLNCDSDEVAENESISISGMGTEGWQPTAPEAPAPLPVAGANSVLFYCQFTADPAVATTFGFDRFYVSKVPAQY